MSSPTPSDISVDSDVQTPTRAVSSDMSSSDIVVPDSSPRALARRQLARQASEESTAIGTTVAATIGPLEVDEPLLRENKKRFVLFPIKYDNIWRMYLKHKAAFWTTSELKLADDKKDWAALTDDERHFLKHIIAFFAASDGIVLENLAERFITEVQIPEARAL